VNLPVDKIDVIHGHLEKSRKKEEMEIADPKPEDSEEGELRSASIIQTRGARLAK
jgi:hypothetical protein